MTPTDHLDRTTEPKLTKFAGTVLAAGLGMAVMGLTAAMANADPAPPNRPRLNPTATQNPHSESGLCNQPVVPRGAPSPPLGTAGKGRRMNWTTLVANALVPLASVISSAAVAIWTKRIDARNKAEDRRHERGSTSRSGRPITRRPC
jgi:hypothetical protein